MPQPGPSFNRNAYILSYSCRVLVPLQMNSHGLATDPCPFGTSFPATWVLQLKIWCFA